MRIDVHAHYWSNDYLDLLVNLGKTDTDTERGLGAGGGAELDARLRLMEQAGVEMQILSASPLQPYVDAPAKATNAARFVNDQYADLVEHHREHFRAFAALPLRGRGGDSMDATARSGTGVDR
jgi:6-methylsalicylate decarboxylase